MNTPYFFSCFLLGVVAAAPVGPLCILVFNRAARSGVLAGMSTGLGAAIGDALYCVLGLVGVLQALTRHQWVMPWLYAAGGIALCAMGTMLIAHRVPASSKVKPVTRYSAMWMQGLMMTVLNPMVALFFMTAGMQVLVGYKNSSVGGVASGVLLGSWSVFTISSLLGSVVGKRVTLRRIAQLQLLTGIILLIVGGSMMMHVAGLSQLFS